MCTVIAVRSYDAELVEIVYHQLTRSNGKGLRTMEGMLDIKHHAGIAGTAAVSDHPMASNYLNKCTSKKRAQGLI